MRATAPLLALSLSITLLLGTPPRPARAAAAAADKPPELKLLDRWVGTWDAQWTAKPTPWMPDGGKFTAEETIDPVLDGRFIHARIASKPDGTHSTWLMTYDSRA